MRAIIEFEMGNAAFEDDPHGELHRVLLSAQSRVLEQLMREPGCVCDAPERADVLHDVNGNRIGTVRVER